MDSIEHTYTLSDLREVPEFTTTIAQRIWQAWWQNKGTLQSEVETHIRSLLGPEIIPSALVAHDGETYLGSALLIESDFAARPHLTPWLAAVWTEEAHRKQGIASTLVWELSQFAFKNGFSRIYLCASDDNTSFYERLGWRVLEYHVKRLNVLALDC